MRILHQLLDGRFTRAAVQFLEFALDQPPHIPRWPSIKEILRRFLSASTLFGIQCSSEDISEVDKICSGRSLRYVPKMINKPLQLSGRQNVSKNDLSALRGFYEFHCRRK